jgi:hypothetical protein
MLRDLEVDIDSLRKKKPTYNDLATMYLELLDVKISELSKKRRHIPSFD